MTVTAPTPYGTVVIQGTEASLSFKRRLPYSVEAVWSALTEPEQRAAWFGATTIDGRAGGTIEMDPADPPAPPEAKHMSGRILVWDPPRVLEHTWHQAIIGETIVRYELAADGDDTILSFTHRGLSVQNAKGFIPGTHAYLDILEAYLGGAELPGWQDRYAAVAHAYA